MGVPGISWLYLVVQVFTFLHVSPGQQSSVVEYVIYEELVEDTSVGSILTDSDLMDTYPGSVRELRFRLLGDPAREPALQYFTVDWESSWIRIGKQIDREEVCPGAHSCRLTFGVGAEEGGLLSIVITVHVDILDLNDNSPSFPQDKLRLNIEEHTLIGRRYKLQPANDPDYGAFSIQNYALDQDYGMFRLEYNHQLKLEVTGNLDREIRCCYTMVIRASDGGSPALTGNITLDITVTDINDHLPVFNDSLFEFTLPENTQSPYLITTLTATDSDSGQNGVVRYAFEGPSGQIPLEIADDSGEVFLMRELDYETAQQYAVTVIAYDQGSRPHTSYATLQVYVQDVNDNPPSISVTGVTSDLPPVVMENLDSGAFVARLIASDADSGDNGRLTCDVSDEHFELVNTWGSQYQLITSTSFNREIISSYNITVTCRDMGAVPMETTQTFRVFVGDQNDNRPLFTQPHYQISVKEGNLVNYVITTVVAKDADVGDNGRITYSILGSGVQFCRVNPVTGTVSASTVLDYELMQQLVVQIEARDNGNPSLASTVTLNMTILDIDDEPPVFTEGRYVFSIQENLPPGQMVDQVRAGDPDTLPANIRYFIRQDQHLALSLFSMDRYTGRLMTKVSLDRERSSLYEVIIVATNVGGEMSRTGTGVLTIQITDVNDNPPQMRFPNNENNTVVITRQDFQGVHVCTVQAIDPDSGENARLTYEFVSQRENSIFHLDPMTGKVLVVTEPQDKGFIVYDMLVVVTDHGEPQRSTNSTLFVGLNSSSYPGGTVEGPVEGGGGAVLRGRALTVFVCIVAVAVVIICLLMAAIGLVLWRGKQSRELPRHKEFQRSGHTPGVVVDDILPSSEEEVYPPDVSMSRISMNSRSNSICSPERRLAEGSEGRHPQTPSSPAGHLLPSGEEPRYIQVHRFLELMKEESDGESGCSGELSNTDSGNGASLENDTPNKRTIPGYPGLATHIHGPRPPYPTQMNTFSHPAIPPSPPPRTSSRSNPTSPTSPTKPSVPTSPTYMNNEMLNRKRRRDAGNGNDANIVKNGNTPSNNSPYYDVICNPTDRMENGGHHFGPGASQPVQGHHFSPVSSQPIQGALKAKLREKRRIQQLKPHTAPLYPLCEVSPERTSTTGASSSSLAQSETPSHVSSLQESRGDTASPVTNCTYGQDTNSVILESNDTEITI